MNLPPQLEPHSKAYMLRLMRQGGKPLPQLSVEAARQYMRDSQWAALEDPSVEIQHIDLRRVKLTIVRPSHSPEPLPAVLYLHGGGWVLGGIETHSRIVRELALRAHAAVVVPEYDLAPEARFPTALDQCYEAAMWLQFRGTGYSIDSSRLAVAGDSAGGNLAAALALRAAARGGLNLRLQALICPALQASSRTQSYTAFADGLNLTREAMEWFWEQYVSGTEQRTEPEVSPLYADPVVLAQAAPALIITAECDVLCDDGELYSQRLTAAGVECTATRFLGTLHNFPVIDDLSESGPARAALRLVGGTLRQALHGSTVRERAES